MERYPKIKVCALFVCCICLLPILSAKADIPAAKEWVEIPVVINIIDGTDANNVDAIIKKAKEILEQAHIRLVVKKINRNVNVGNNDDNLNRAERDEARRKGQQDVNDTCGAGKGIKIDFVTNCKTEKASTTGISVHRTPVVIVEPDTDPNARGRTVAHEIGHVLTLHDTYDLNDINDLMYGYVGGGTTLGPNDVNEIFGNAKKRGRSYFVVPRVLPGQSVAIPCGIDYSIDAHGAILDGCYDQDIIDPCGVIPGPDCPTIGYADMREILLSCDEPFDLANGTTLEIQLGGTRPLDFPADSFFDVFFSCHLECPPFGVSYIDAPAFYPPTAVWYCLITSTEIPLSPPIIHKNEEFDTDDLYIANDSLEATIPTEIIAMNLVSAEPIIVNVNSYADDYRVPDSDPIWIDDFTEPFEFGLTQPCGGPSIRFTPFGVSGRGFTGGVDIEFDGVLFDTIMTLTDGTFMYFMDPTLPLEPGRHSVIAQEADDSGPTGAAHAAGYFNYSPCGETTGDLDGDGDVDFSDVAILAGNWLACK